MTNLEPKYDEYGDVVNHEQTYQALAQKLKKDGSVIIGWTDGQGSHHDVLFNLQPKQFGSLQGGMRGSTDLFVSVMRVGCFGFDKSRMDTFHTYTGEKLGIGGSATTVELTELINQVRKQLQCPL